MILSEAAQENSSIVSSRYSQNSGTVLIYLIKEFLDINFWNMILTDIRRY
jgi:hypothetical protein